MLTKPGAQLLGFGLPKLKQETHASTTLSASHRSLARRVPMFEDAAGASLPRPRQRILKPSSSTGLLGLQSLDILQERLLMAFGLDVLVDLAEGTIGVDDKAGAIPVHRTFVLALPHSRRL